jgi:hypothetical protein
MSKLDKLRPTPRSEMKAVIIYDGFAFAAQANAMLQRAGHRADVDVHWNIKPWRLNALKNFATAKEALMGAADAHLIVLAGRHAESLPIWLREWLTNWASIREIPDAALALMRTLNGGLSRPATLDLSRFVRQHGLTFIIDECPVAKDTVKLLIRSSREREVPVPVTQSRFAETVTRDSYRGWGINE